MCFYYRGFPIKLKRNVKGKEIQTDREDCKRLKLFHFHTSLEYKKLTNKSARNNSRKIQMIILIEEVNT